MNRKSLQGVAVQIPVRCVHSDPVPGRARLAWSAALAGPSPAPSNPAVSDGESPRMPSDPLTLPWANGWWCLARGLQFRVMWQRVTSREPHSVPLG